MVDNELLEKARLVQRGLQQFDSIHQPKVEKVSEEKTILVCQTCDVDFPCERMLVFMLIQGVATLNAMIPSGNPANVLNRFMGGNNRG